MNTPSNPRKPPPRTLIVIGSSTGGPPVLRYLAGALPLLPACIVMVQHMPRYINESVVRTLGRISGWEVELAQSGMELREGRILVAPSEVHCEFASNREVRLVGGPKVNFVRPSIDVAMMSLAAPAPGQRFIGVILTGMGRDGAAGLAHMKRLGSLTIAQDEASCAVYGMPAEAFRLGCVDRLLPPERIARLLARAAS